MDKKIELWNILFEAKHAEFNRQVIYEGLQGEELKQIKAQKLRSFLNTLKEEDIQSMKAKDEELPKLIPQALQDLKKLVPARSSVTTHYLIPSLNTSSGAGRPYDRDMVVYYGLEERRKFLALPEQALRILNSLKKIGWLIINQNWLLMNTNFRIMFEGKSEILESCDAFKDQ